MGDEDGPTFSGGAVYFGPVGTPAPKPEPAWVRRTPERFRRWYQHLVTFRHWQHFGRVADFSIWPEGDHR